VRWVGAALLGALILLTAACRVETRAIRTRWQWLSFDIPARRDLVEQVGLAVVDVVAAGLALWALLPHADVSFITFITVYAAAMLLGMIGHTPGGVGVFEAAMVFTLNGSVATQQMLAALLAYRAIYFGAPLVVSAALLAGFEGRALKGRLPLRHAAGASKLAPLFLSLVTFVVGGMLVISSATPAFWQRLHILRDVLPLWVLESSQMLCSVLGVLLLFVARARAAAASRCRLVDDLAAGGAEPRLVAHQGSGVCRSRCVVHADRAAARHAPTLQSPFVAVCRAFHGGLARVGRDGSDARDVGDAVRVP